MIKSTWDMIKRHKIIKLSIRFRRFVERRVDSEMWVIQIL